MCSLEPDHVVCQDQLLPILVIIYITAVTDFHGLFILSSSPSTPSTPTFYLNPGPTRKQMSYPKWVNSDDNPIVYKDMSRL